MNLTEIEENIEKAETLLEELKNKCKDEIINIVSSFTIVDRFECVSDCNVRFFEIVRITPSRVIYNSYMIYKPEQPVSHRSSHNAFITKLCEFSNFKKKLRRE